MQWLTGQNGVWKRTISPNQLLKSYSAKAQNMGDVRESSLGEIFCTLLLLNSAKPRAYLLRILSRKLKPVVTEGKLCQRVKRYRAGACCVPAQKSTTGASERQSNHTEDRDVGDPSQA